jgi:hypothetical protein
MSGSGAAVFIGLIVAVLYIIGLTLVQSALQAIFQTALYLYARNGKAPQGFENAGLEHAVAVKG